MKKIIKQIKITDLLAIAIGTSLYAWALININIPAKLAEGGMTGITLIIKSLFGVSPALSTLLLNIPLLIIGYKFLGKRTIAYTIIGTLLLSFWLKVWEQFPMSLDLDGDIVVATVMTGVISGVGSGIVYRFGGTTGGSDVIARILEKKLSIPMGRTLFSIDLFVLTASLIYIDIRHMMYTIILAFIFANVVNSMLNTGYTAKALMIMTKKPQELSDTFINELDRGTTLFRTEGGFSKKENQAVYIVVDPSEMNQVREIIKRVDETSFVSIYDAQEQLGEGFTFAPKKKKLF
ncbi:MAG: YitT family protein [Lactobacillaceae bacterium]|nr:YitT family protein [Lactobacillaceae bacterium]